MIKMYVLLGHNQKGLLASQYFSFAIFHHWCLWIWHDLTKAPTLHCCHRRSRKEPARARCLSSSSREIPQSHQTSEKKKLSNHHTFWIPRSHYRSLIFPYSFVVGSVVVHSYNIIATKSPCFWLNTPSRSIHIHPISS